MLVAPPACYRRGAFCVEAIVLQLAITWRDLAYCSRDMARQGCGRSRSGGCGFHPVALHGTSIDPVLTAQFLELEHQLQPCPEVSRLVRKCPAPHHLEGGCTVTASRHGLRQSDGDSVGSVTGAERGGLFAWMPFLSLWSNELRGVVKVRHCARAP